MPKLYMIAIVFTPHARGSTLILSSTVGLEHVYPACAGIDLWKKTKRSMTRCLPRMRGDRPKGARGGVPGCRFTPHARGSTPRDTTYYPPSRVYPACAGIDPHLLIPATSLYSLPRMRGDRPRSALAAKRNLAFTPHARGSTSSRHSIRVHPLVYPACAGIDHELLDKLPTGSGLPRMRGDRPEIVSAFR